MLKRRRGISALTLVVFTFYMLALAGCGEDDVAAPEAQAPDIPAATTFLMDFGDFAGNPALTGAAEKGEITLGAPKTNWSYAALNVLIWNTIVTVGLAVPVASFIAAAGRQPVKHPEGDWVWSYNFYVNEVLHLAELHGNVEDGQVIWGMYISKEGEYSEFLWYSGISDIEGTGGSWTVYNNPDDPSPMLLIEWIRDPDGETWEIKYTNIIPGDDENGGYIYHGIVDDEDYDAFYDIYNKGADNHTYIEWNRASKAGRVKDEGKFDDSDWHCWNSLLENADCP